MFLLDNPYVSDFLRQSVETMERSVVDTPAARTFMNGSTAPFIDETEFARRILVGERVYTNSENGLDVILRNAGQSDLARQIEICKDKALFRETVAALYPDYRFARVTPDDLDSFDVSDMPYPFVAKPARGFSVSACTWFSSRPSGRAWWRRSGRSVRVSTRNILKRS